MPQSSRNNSSQSCDSSASCEESSNVRTDDRGQPRAEGGGRRAEDRGRRMEGKGVPSWNRLSGMNTKTHGRREEIRYSEAFKMEVVRELEMGGIAFDAISLKYGIKGSETVSRWVRQYGNGT